MEVYFSSGSVNAKMMQLHHQRRHWENGIKEIRKSQPQTKRDVNQKIQPLKVLHFLRGSLTLASAFGKQAFDVGRGTTPLECNICFEPLPTSSVVWPCGHLVDLLFDRADPSVVLSVTVQFATR